MASEHAILLISDRPNQSRELARGLGNLCACRMIGLHEEKTAAGPVSAIVTDVGLRHPRNVERLRNLLLQPRASAVPIVAILRDDSHLERVQAAAVGATSLFGAHAAISDISAALAPVIRSTIVSAAPAATVDAGAERRAGPTRVWNPLWRRRARRICQQDGSRQGDNVCYGSDNRRRHPTMARSCLDT